MWRGCVSSGGKAGGILGMGGGWRVEGGGLVMGGFGEFGGCGFAADDSCLRC